MMRSRLLHPRIQLVSRGPDNPAPNTPTILKSLRLLTVFDTHFPPHAHSAGPAVQICNSSPAWTCPYHQEPKQRPLRGCPADAKRQIGLSSSLSLRAVECSGVIASLCRRLASDSMETVPATRAGTSHPSSVSSRRRCRHGGRSPVIEKVVGIPRKPYQGTLTVGLPVRSWLGHRCATYSCL